MGRSQCLWCESTRLADGRLHSTGRLYFKADNTRFWIFATSEVDVMARVCVECGYIDLYADTSKLKKLVKDE